MTTDHDPIRIQLDTFLSNNPEAEYGKDEKGAVIKRPWGDTTIELRIPEKPEELVAALNKVILPPRFTAIWHSDSQDLEVIWTAVPVDAEIRARSFEFHFRDSCYACNFGDSSQRLLCIADASRPIGPANYTSHRNLGSFYSFVRRSRKEGGSPPQGLPTSYWIRKIQWDENLVIELSHHLNFYMRYFDRRSPTVLVHEDIKDEGKENSLRYPFESFPAKIMSRNLDIYLLRLWESTITTTDPFLRFLYNYQILEYIAFYYIQDEILEKLKRILTAPETPCRPSVASTQILNAVVDSKMTDEQKIQAVIKELVDPEAVWKEIEPHLSYFSMETQFDGGLTIPPLVKSNWTFQDFKIMWAPHFSEALTKLRNALVHARERRMVGVIAPTKANSNRIRPWLGPITMAAMQAMVNKEL